MTLRSQGDDLPNAAAWNVPPLRPQQETTIRHRVRELIAQHGGLRPAARAIRMTPQYLLRLGNGEKTNASAKVLRKLGLVRVVTYLRAVDSSAKEKL
jgi:nitrate reductase beta subunit